MNQDLTAQVSEVPIEPAATSQKDDETQSDRSKSEVGSVQGDAVVSENSAPQSQTDGSMNQASSANEPSRNSTQDTNEADSMSDMSDAQGGGARDGYGIYVPPGAPRYAGDDGLNNGYPVEQEREEDGTPILTNKFLRELLKTPRLNYYRTPCLNSKLIIHFKGFNQVKNLEPFTGLKCLYFEGNGAKSTKGLEKNTKMLSLFMQENVIEEIEGLETLKELRNLNLADNCIKKVSGLSGCVELETLNLKRNRIGAGGTGLEDLQGLLECPSLTSIDISDNHIDDPTIIDEIFAKLPNIRVIYAQNNSFIKKVNAYRKTMISKLPELRYLDDRPVFPEDRRRADAYARGGIEEERKEMKSIKKEKEDRHWANHEAFRLMIQKAKQDKKEAEERKVSMKEMMAEAKVRREEAKAHKAQESGSPSSDQIAEEKKEEPADPSKDIFGQEDLPVHEQAKDFARQLAELAEKRFQEKQQGIPHSEDPDNNPIQKEMDAEEAAQRKEWAGEFKDAEKKQAALNASGKDVNGLLKEMPTAGKGGMLSELPQEAEDDDCPALEKATEEELKKAKAQQQEEWLKTVVDKHTNGKAEPAEVPEHLQNVGSGLNQMQAAHDGLGDHKATLNFTNKEEDEKKPTPEATLKSMMNDLKVQEAMGYRDMDELAANPTTTEFDELD